MSDDDTLTGTSNPADDNGTLPDGKGAAGPYTVRKVQPFDTLDIPEYAVKEIKAAFDRLNDARALVREASRNLRLATDEMWLQILTAVPAAERWDLSHNIETNKVRLLHVNPHMTIKRLLMDLGKAPE